MLEAPEFSVLGLGLSLLLFLAILCRSAIGGIGKTAQAALKRLMI